MRSALGGRFSKPRAASDKLDAGLLQDALYGSKIVRHGHGPTGLEIADGAATNVRSFRQSLLAPKKEGARGTDLGRCEGHAEKMRLNPQVLNGTICTTITVMVGYNRSGQSL